MTPAIRPARPEDAAVVVELIRRLAAFEEPGAEIALTEEAVRRDAFGPHPRFKVLLAEADGRVCGLMTLLEGYSSWAGAPTLTIHDLFVAEEARGRGLGQALVAEAVRLARAAGACRLDVNVVGWNQAAQDFYAALGFSPLDDWRPWRLAFPA